MKLVGGVLLIGVALFMTLGFAVSETSRGLGTTLMALFVSVAVPGGAGIALIRNHFQSRRLLTADRAELRLQTWETELVKLAGRKGGKLTVVEAVSETGLRVPQVEEALASLARQGVADIDVTESGLLVYRFPDVLLLEEKGGSKPILDS